MKRILISCFFLLYPFLSINAENSFVNDDIEAVSITKNQDLDNLVNVSDEEVDNLILYLENDEKAKGKKPQQSTERKKNDPYYDLKLSLASHNVDGIEKNIIVGMVVDDTPTNLYTGLMLLYTNICNMFIHPLIVFCIVVLLILLVVTACLVFLKYKKNDTVNMKKYISFAAIEVLFTVYFIALIFEDYVGYSLLKKYIFGALYVFASIFVGFFLGNIFSKYYFEEKILP